MDNNLPELRDIHLPPADISFFPLAYGWWLLLSAVLAAVILFFLIRRLLRQSKKRYALRLLDQEKDSSTPIAAAVGMSEILRRICVYKYPAAAALYGKKWVEFLNSRSKERLVGKPAHLLQDAPYISVAGSRNYDAEDVKGLYRFCRQWIGENL